MDAFKIGQPVKVVVEWSCLYNTTGKIVNTYHDDGNDIIRIETEDGKKYDFYMPHLQLLMNQVTIEDDNETVSNW